MLVAQTLQLVLLIICIYGAHCIVDGTVVVSDVLVDGDCTAEAIGIQVDPLVVLIKRILYYLYPNSICSWYHHSEQTLLRVILPVPL